MKGRQTVDMEAVDSTANAQYRVNCCGLGSKEGEVVGDVGEAFSLSLRLGSPTICRAKAHSDNASSMVLYTEYHGRDYECYMDYTAIDTDILLHDLVRASLAAHSSS